MSRPTARIPVLGVFALLAAAFGSYAQNAPARSFDLSGTYEIGNASVGDATATLDFKATIANNGASDVAGTVLLRDANVAGKVYGRFGRQTIAAGKTVMVMSSVTVPRAEYDAWSGSRGPSLYLYAEGERGEIATVKIPVTRIAVVTPPR